MTQPLVQLGTLTRPHGVRGALYAYCDGDALDHVMPGETLTVRREADEPRVYTVRSLRASGKPGAKPGAKYWVVALEGIESVQDAEALRNAALLMEVDRLPPLEDGVYYIAQLRGLEVIDQHGQSVGTVRDVMETGAHDILQVVDDDGNEILIPHVEAFVGRVDLSAGQIHVTLWEGMRDAD